MIDYYDKLQLTGWPDAIVLILTGYFVVTFFTFLYYNDVCSRKIWKPYNEAVNSLTSLRLSAQEKIKTLLEGVSDIKQGHNIIKTVYKDFDQTLFKCDEWRLKANASSKYILQVWNPIIWCKIWSGKLPKI